VPQAREVQRERGRSGLEGLGHVARRSTRKRWRVRHEYISRRGVPQALWARLELHRAKDADAETFRTRRNRARKPLNGPRNEGVRLDAGSLQLRGHGHESRVAAGSIAVRRAIARTRRAESGYGQGMGSTYKTYKTESKGDEFRRGFQSYPQHATNRTQRRA
jgi:hypothetical protein